MSSDLTLKDILSGSLPCGSSGNPFSRHPFVRCQFFFLSITTTDFTTCHLSGSHLLLLLSPLRSQNSGGHSARGYVIPVRQLETPFKINPYVIFPDLIPRRPSINLF